MRKSKATVRIFSFLVVMTMLFSACASGGAPNAADTGAPGTAVATASDTGSTDNAQTAATDTPAAAETPAATDTPAATAAPSDANTASQDLVTLQVFSMSSNYSGIQTGWWCDVLKQDLGIQIELVPAGDQGEQKLQVLMAGGELPDVVVFKETKFVLDAMRAGLIIPFSDHLDQIPNVVKNMPDAMKYFADNVSDDGKCYSLPSSVGNTPTVEDFGWGPMLRWDLYAKLGYPEVKTIDDYIPLLKQMMQINPTDENGDSTYGLTLWSDWDNLYMNLAGAFGSMQGISEGLSGIPLAEVDYKTMKMRSMLDPTSAYMQDLHFFYEANQAGIVDPASITQRYDTAAEKTSAGQVFFSFWPWGSAGYSTADRANAADFSGFKAIPFTDGYAPVTYDNNPIGRDWSISISSSSKNVDRALAFVNYMADPNNTMIFQNGPQGFLWDIDSSGTPYTTDQGYQFRLNADADMPGGGKLRDGMQQINYWPLGIGNIADKYGVGAEYRLWPGYTKAMTALDKDYVNHIGYPDNVTRTLAIGSTTPQPLATQLLAPVPDDMQQLSVRIGDVVKNDSWLIVFAKDDADYQQQLTQMVNDANSQGLPDLLTYDAQAWQAAVDIAAKYQ